jgi:hypothetical protein
VLVGRVLRLAGKQCPPSSSLSTLRLPVRDTFGNVRKKLACFSPSEAVGRNEERYLRQIHGSRPNIRNIIGRCRGRNNADSNSELPQFCRSLRNIKPKLNRASQTPNAVWLLIHG